DEDFRLWCVWIHHQYGPARARNTHTLRMARLTCRHISRYRVVTGARHMPVPRASVDKVSSTPSRTGAQIPVDLGRAVTSASHSAATLTMAKVESDIDMGRKERNLIFRSVAPAMTTATPRETRLVRNRYRTADSPKPRPSNTLSQSINSKLSGN